ncbi:serine/threonine-protein kinase [Streptomyces sp. NPDC056485]|uniref:serine/threonine-protein kinase n=1 Tax=Streptomyces sp. NPDC056485 TaxID=3345834 RepID=UPI003674A192
MLPDTQVLDDRYELRTLLGEGSMGQVWHAFDRELRRTVAVKLIQPYRLASGARTDRAEMFRQRFRREARLLARFGHPGVPVLYDARLASDAPHAYIVMELVLGHDLDRVLLEHHRLPVGRLVSIGIQVCDVLHVLHGDPVIHRDLKPSNIMVTTGDRVKLLDFGTAAVFGSEHPRLTAAGELVGTVDYMAPEQFDSPLVGDPRSDLYSLGCVLYHMAAGSPPFTGPATRVMRDHISRAPVPLRDHCPDIDPRLDALILATLAKHPGDRPASARELLDGLNRHTAPRTGSLPLTAAIRPLPPRLPEPAERAELAELPELPDDISAGPGAAAIDPRVSRAAAFFADGRFGSALPLYLALAEGASDEAVEYRARAATCRRYLGDTAAALEEFQDLAADLEASHPPDARLFLDVRRQIGLLLTKSRQWGPALEALAEVYPALEPVFGPDSVEMAEVRAALSTIRRLG